MRYDCPQCGIDLKGRLLRTRALPGQRRLFPSNGTLACPDCKAFLGSNPVPGELKSALSTVAVCSVFLFGLPYLKKLPEPTKSLAYVIGGLCVLAGLAACFVHALRLRRRFPNWQRYRLYEPGKLPNR